MENNSIAISALQHYIYCPRQCGLIHVAQVWSENLHTQKGRREHDRVDVPEYEIKAGVRIERALPGSKVLQSYISSSFFFTAHICHSSRSGIFFAGYSKVRQKHSMVEVLNWQDVHRLTA